MGSHLPFDGATIIDAEHPEGRPALPSDKTHVPQGFQEEGEGEDDSPAPSDSTAPPPQGASSPPPPSSPPPAQASPPPPSSSPPSSSPPPPTTPVSSPPPPTDPSSPPPPPPAGSKSPPPSSSPPPPSGGGDPSLPSQPLSPPPPSATPSTPVPDGINATTAPVTLAPPGSISVDPGVFNAPPSQSLPGAPGRPLPTPPQPRGTPSDKPPASSAASNTPPSSGSSSSNNTVLIAGVVMAGVVLIAFVGIWLFCSKKKKKQPYYVDGRPPKGKDQFYNGTNQSQWNSPNPMDHVVKLPPPPGVMGTPVGPGAGWGVPPPPPQANTSSEFSSGFSGHNQAGVPTPSPLGGFNKGQFSYEELAAATDGFSQANVLGQGGFGFVHKGVLRDGREVAVKSLKSGSGQGEREFQAEVEIITRVHHRHLVSLVGYCITDGQRMLVYEFVSNKTLEFHLHGKGQPVMEWEIRLRIALGSARGLAYLHEDCHPKIIHRDIKAANILLDDKYEAMVADFGLAKLSSDNHTHVSTRVMGTFGYLAPEYASSGKLTEKSDVFSFGVMLLELITGKRPVDPTNKFMEDSLVDWARPVLAKALEDGDYREIADPRLEGNYAAHEMAQMIACAAASIRHSARRRPKMSQIVRTLEGDLSLEDLNDGATKQRQSTNFGSVGSSSVETQTYDTGMYNADMTKFRKMIMNSQEFNSSEFGATSDYGLNPSSSSSDSREYDGTSEHPKPKV